MSRPANHGPDRFIADLVDEGLVAGINGLAIVYSVIPISGSLANESVPTAVGVSELQSWPAVVPHWLHFPDWIIFDETNKDNAECLSGWSRHSREIGQLDTSVPVVRTFLRHVRGALSAARRAS